MARRETIESNLLVMRDNLSDSMLGVYYRQPATSERQDYINKRSVRQGKRFVDNSAACRVKFAKKIITGLRDGDFERPDEHGGWRGISSNPQSPDYLENWQDWMEANAADVLTALAVRVFEAPVIAVGVNPDEDLDQD